MTEPQRTAEKRLLSTFLDLVRIDSPSGSEAECASYCERVLRAAGCSVRYDDAARLTGSDCGNLIAELAGTADGTLVLSAHMDCVEPCRGVEPVLSEGTIFSAGDTVLGADDKCGLAAAIECVRRLAEDGRPHPTIRCVFTVQEEVGLTGAKALCAEDVDGDLCLVLDAAGSPGGIIVGAPTHYTFVATVVGKAAHAGVEPEAGVSAVKIAGEMIARLPIGRVDGTTTANVGTVKGGTATNVIAARVELTGECRSLDRERVEALVAEMDQTMRATAAENGGGVDIEWNREYEGFLLPDDAGPVRVVSEAVRDLGLEPQAVTTGGGSDANIIASLGVPTVALSCGMAGVHSTGEQIETADLETVCGLCVAVARRLAR